MQGFIKKITPGAVVVIICLLFFAAGFFVAERSANPKSDSDQGIRRELRSRGTLTNPLLECDVSKGVYTELQPFEVKIEDYVNRQLKNTQVKDIAVYFRDLNNGPWFGVNELKDYSPASLLKVPIMLAYLRYANGDPSILEKKLTIDTVAPDDMQNIKEVKPAVPLTAGDQYSVDDLIRRMIESSDNAAAKALLDNLDQRFLNNTFTDLGMIVPEERSLEDFMSVKEYASFFRILFNASYLSKPGSEKALQYLTRSAFTEGIIAGVPVGITVAHKFGERVTSDHLKQLHDCGIVYYPNRPYVLCIMTRGTDFDALAKTIKEISTLVYQEIDTQRKNQIP